MNTIMTHKPTDYLHRKTAERLRKILVFVFCLAVAVLTHESLLPSIGAPSLNYWDKLVHYVAYFILAGLALFAFVRTKLLALFIVLSLLGGGLEIGQALMDAGRDGTWGDQLANMLGAATPLRLWYLYCRIKKPT